MHKPKFNVAIVGATGLVGETLLELLAERSFPVEHCYPLASERSLGATVRFNQQTLDVSIAEQFDFKKADIAFFSAGGAVSEKLAPKAAAAGCLVIDNTSQFRYDDDVPLVVPEVNGDQLNSLPDRGIIANPNCSTIQLVVALKPIYDAVGIARIIVSTYQSVSGAGRRAIEQLAKDTVSRLGGEHVEENTIAFNAVPHIDTFQKNGYTREEMKLVWETRKILSDHQLVVNATAVRVPVFFGHSESVFIETAKPVSAAVVKTLLKSAPGVKLLSDDEDYPTAVTHGATQDWVYVGRVREALETPSGLQLWVVADNIRKGAALNAIQIAEQLIERRLL